MSREPRITLELDPDGTLWLTQASPHTAAAQVRYHPPANTGPPWGQAVPHGVRTKVAKITSTALVALTMERPRD